ncbi:ABC transporter ATP-binding protein [Paraburkholderia tropica]|uniref:ABC transporter ATP-binding protein n=2 Tax=Paraburkholderia TaxID=1822464 RepID=UPI001CAEE427|nr:ATP-binding cassette domain-containing protein [Paraburkholderia tropica]CAG9196755.1 ABC transporter ATP-binding protein [Paraburkholderia tropica]
MNSQNDSNRPRVDARAPLVEAHGIARRDAQRGQVLLHPTDFALHNGERVVLTGPSGSGKSVFLRALALLDPLDSPKPHDGGALRWHGEPVTRARIPSYRRHIAYLRQRPALIDGSVEDNLRYPYSLAVYRDTAFDAARVRALLDATGRGADFLARAAADLSGGEAQIVALVRVLQLDPEALLLDEPTASLDPESAREVEALVAQWFEQRRDARATVWVSHDPAQAQRVGTRHITMRAGVLDADGASSSTTLNTQLIPGDAP